MSTLPVIPLFEVFIGVTFVVTGYVAVRAGHRGSAAVLTLMGVTFTAFGALAVFVR